MIRYPDAQANQLEQVHMRLAEQSPGASILTPVQETRAESILPTTVSRWESQAGRISLSFIN